MAAPVLYLFVGYPGAGKTSLAKIIHEYTRAVHIWADHERHKLFPKPTHSVAESNKLYEHLNNLTDKLLAKGVSVIFDTNFNFYNDRQNLRKIARSHGAETKLIWLTTPKEQAKQRAVGEAAKIRNGYFQAMTDGQFAAITAKLERPSRGEKAIKIDGTDLDKAAVIKKLDL